MQVSISTTFYELLYGQYSFAKILQTETASSEKLLKTLSYKKLIGKNCGCFSRYLNVHVLFQIIKPIILQKKKFLVVKKKNYSSLQDIKDPKEVELKQLNVITG